MSPPNLHPRVPSPVPVPPAPHSGPLGYAQPCPPPPYSRQAGRAPKSFTLLRARRCPVLPGCCEGHGHAEPVPAPSAARPAPAPAPLPRSSRSSHESVPGARPPGWLALSTAVPWQEEGWRGVTGRTSGRGQPSPRYERAPWRVNRGAGRAGRPRAPRPRSCTHPGCCACRGGRSAAGGARGPRSPGETRGHTAAPAATAGREAGGRREPRGAQQPPPVTGCPREGDNPPPHVPPGGDIPALVSEGRLSPKEQSKGAALAPNHLCDRPHRSRPGSCRTGPGTRRSYLSRRPGSAAPCRGGTAASSGPTAAAECAASGPAGEAEHNVRPRPHRAGAKSRERGGPTSASRSDRSCRDCRCACTITPVQRSRAMRRMVFQSCWRYFCRNSTARHSGGRAGGPRFPPSLAAVTPGTAVLPRPWGASVGTPVGAAHAPGPASCSPRCR